MCKKCDDRPATFRPSRITAAEVKSAIPGRLFIPDTSKSLYYLARDISVTALLAWLAWTADRHLEAYYVTRREELQVYVSISRGLVWCLYWWFQSLSFASLWLLAHECGHGSLFPYSILNNFVGFVLHSFVGTPYYSWKYSHRQHHRFNGHVEKDEHYIPKVLDADQPAHGSGFWEAVEDTPIFQVIKLAFQQIFGFQSYLLVNVSGQARYKGWTSHFNPFCALYRHSQRFDIILSDVGLLLNLAFLVYAARAPPLSTGAVVRIYGIPWILLNHWIAMIVSLQHTDSMLPRYRDGAYTFARGALVTVDREFLGWQGKFFLHYVAHCHVLHHFFPSMPFYHLEEATQYAKKVLGDDYISCDTSGFKALWQNALRCQYVDAKGDIVFYKDKTGSARFRTACENDPIPMRQ
ncbi:FAD2 [Sanghuangporus vaninii]